MRRAQLLPAAPLLELPGEEDPTLERERLRLFACNVALFGDFTIK